MPETDPSHEAPRVLVVEDSATQAQELKHILEQAGFDTEVAEDGFRGFDSFQRSRFAVIVSDVMMPGLSGYELCRRVKQTREGSSTPFILLTSLRDWDDIAEGLKCGADNFITKPYEPSRLIRRIRYVLARHRKDSGASTPSQHDAASANMARVLDYLGSTFDDFRQAKEAEYRRKLAQLEQQKQMLRQREEFMAALTHDLRNPLVGAARIQALMLEGRANELSPEQRRLVGILAESTKSLLEMINNLLDVYHRDDGSYEAFREVTDLSSLVTSSVDELGELARARGLEVEHKLPAEPVTIISDRLAIRRLLTNLLSNAIRFTPQGGYISVSLAQKDKSAVIEVSDSGQGIRPEEQDRIFERFWSGGLAKRCGVTTGLGLYLCRQIVLDHKGEITFSSEPGKGTTFTVKLPTPWLASSAGGEEQSQISDHASRTD